MRMPITLLLILAFITVATNWDYLGQLGGDELGNEEKMLIGSNFIVLTPHRVAYSAWSSFASWQETGEIVALGSVVLFGAGLLFLFLFGFSVIGWLIGFVRPFKSEERQSFIAFVATLGFFAVLIAGPLDPTARGIGTSVLIFSRDFLLYLVTNPVMIPVLIVGLIIAVLVLRVVIPRISRKVRRRRA